MSDNNHKINEAKIQYDNVFSIPIVQYQTTDTDELNKEGGSAGIVCLMME